MLSYLWKRTLSTSLNSQQSPLTLTVKKSRPIPRKAILTLTSSAVARLKLLQESPNKPKYLKIGTKKKGCSGQVYTLEYVDTISKLDEVVEQENVKIVVDSKALFSIIGSEMDYVEDALSSQFIFHNPNVKESCGCGQSFMV